jgi:DNA-binding NtrC family response regulator
MSPKLNFEVVPLASVPKNEPSAKPNPHVVLIVDDERVIADTLSAILSRSGFAVMTAYNAKTALEFASITPPELLITDVAMPGMNGIDLAISLVQSIPDCKVLLFSGQASTIDLLDKAREDGHNFNLLSKPIHPTDMLKRISDCFAERELLQPITWSTERRSVGAAAAVPTPTQTSVTVLVQQ